VLGTLKFEPIMQQLPNRAPEPYQVFFLSYMNGLSHQDAMKIEDFIFPFVLQLLL
jgi:hypothetical protein